MEDADNRSLPDLIIQAKKALNKSADIGMSCIVKGECDPTMQLVYIRKSMEFLLLIEQKLITDNLI